MGQVDRMAIMWTIGIVVVAILIGTSFSGSDTSTQTSMNEKTMDKEMMDKEMMDKEMMDKEMMDKEMMDKEMMDKEMMDKEMMDKEMMDKEMMDKEMMEKEMMEKEMMDKEMMEKEMMDKEMMDKEMMGSQSVTVKIPNGASLPKCADYNECYNPEIIEISEGDTVIWKNNDISLHTVTAGNLKTDPNLVGEDYPNGWDSSIFASDTSYSRTFDDSGTYDYYCLIHPWMVGQVVVN